MVCKIKFADNSPIILCLYCLFQAILKHSRSWVLIIEEKKCCKNLGYPEFYSGILNNAKKIIASSLSLKTFSFVIRMTVNEGELLSSFMWIFSLPIALSLPNPNKSFSSTIIKIIPSQQVLFSGFHWLEWWANLMIWSLKFFPLLQFKLSSFNFLYSSWLEHSAPKSQQSVTHWYYNLPKLRIVLSQVSFNHSHSYS